jgi:hypothetical protein
VNFKDEEEDRKNIGISKKKNWMQKTLKMKLNKSTKYIRPHNLNEFEKPKEW